MYTKLNKPRMLIDQCEKRENQRGREGEKEPIRPSVNAKLVTLVRERSRLRLARPANFASYVSKSGLPRCKNL